MTFTTPGEPATNGFSLSQRVAKLLIDIQAVKFNVQQPFTWTSGIKSPIYCDNRILMSDVEIRGAIIDAFTNMISNKYLYQTDIIAGVATGGIPYGALAADRLKLPFIYVRQERKKHGLAKWVEGVYHQGDKIVLIEDHISTGGSSMNAIEGLKSEKLELICLLSIMTYGFKKAEESFKNANVKYESLCNLNTLLDVALRQGIITSDDADTILQFRESPSDWRP